MTDQKWTSPHGHAIASHVTDKLPKVSGMGVAVEGVKKPSFQESVAPWMNTTFGSEISNNIIERNHRFLEESLELVQSKGCTQFEAHQLVDYVYGRPIGDPEQEVGGVMVTLAALCLSAKIDMHECGETELSRVWTMVEKIRMKQAAKPKFSPLPQAVEHPRSNERGAENQDLVFFRGMLIASILAVPAWVVICGILYGIWGLIQKFLG